MVREKIDVVKDVLFSDLTEPQRRAITELAKAEMRDSPAWLAVTTYYSRTVSKLRSLDLIVVSDTGLDDAKLRITGRGMNYYRNVLCNFKPRDKLSDDDIREIIEMCEAGFSQDAIAAKFSITQAHVSNIRRGTYPKPVQILKEMGLEPASSKPHHDDRVRRTALRMRRQGKSYGEICEYLNIAHGTLGKWIRDADMVVEGHVSDETRRRIVRMAINGMTYSEIARSLGRSRRLVKDAMKAFYAGVLDVS